MPGSFYGINLAARSLRAFQHGLDVTGHNIANANTAGYTRQALDLNSLSGSRVYGVHPFSVGGGVDIGSVNRVRDQFLDARRQSAESQLTKSDTLQTTVGAIQGVLNEPGASGVSAALGKFFDAWSGLAGNASDSGTRIQVQQAGQTLVSRIKDAFVQIEQQASNNTGNVNLTLDRVDELAGQISTINVSIQEAFANGAMPNDLLDQRQQMINELDQLADVHTDDTANGGILISIGGFSLVDGAGSHAVPRGFDPVTSRLIDSNGHTFQISGGSLSAFMTSEARIKDAMTQLNTLANTLRTEVNTIHATGTNLLGGSGINFFNTGTGAGDLALDDKILADPKAISAGATGKPGDGGLALSLSALRDTKVVALGDRSFTTFYSEFASSVSREVGFYKNLVDTQTAVVQQIDKQIESISGVSVDDEMADMLKLQRSYQAAAKTLSIFDQITEDLINLVR